MTKKPSSVKVSRRKGATSTQSVPRDVLKQLNLGLIESATLSEALVVDFDVLANSIGLIVPPLQEKTFVKRMREMAAHLSDWKIYRGAKSDTVRGWAAYSLANSPELRFKAKLREMRYFAADAHFGVREWAWLSMRDHILGNLDAAIEELSSWAGNSDPNIRRFASESTRPRGVWCSHIESLKNNPELALPILEPLKSDESKYVRDSVGNWLNDASKSSPKWVAQVSARWKRESTTKETAYILKKALRSMT